MTQAERRHDRLAVRLSLIISRLVAGETLNMARLAAEFGVSVRTLRRDFRERLMYLDLEYRRGQYRLRSTGGGVQVRQQLLTCLLERHYGLTLNDTPFHDDASTQEYIEAGITLADAVNFLVERYELVRTDRKGFTWQEQTPLLTATDILRARRATGLMNT